MNRSVTQPITQTLLELDELDNHPPFINTNGRVPVLLFGNVLPDPEALSLFEGSGCLVVGADTCTGARQHVSYEFDNTEDLYIQMARSMMNHPPCARTISIDDPGLLGKRVLESARKLGAKGVIAHVMKFCDPYLTRMPHVFDVLKKADMPYLMLEGDCTLRSFGQYRTRIEAFVEMLA
jgi:benzoyl-CoA reductase/2-hydroxyglutaryl-CoA dehydratase subunit BcrC/BadD/HgdB